MRQSPLWFALGTVAVMSAVASAPAALAATEPNAPASTVQKPPSAADLRRQEIDLRKQSQTSPDDPKPHILLATLYLEEQNLPAAEAEARLARADKGSPEEVDPLLAQALLQQSKFSELFRDVKPDDRQPKAESQVRVALGVAHLAFQELDQAQPLLQSAEQLDESAAAPKRAMAMLLLAQGNVPDAQKEIDAASAIAPDDVSIGRIVAHVLRARGDRDGAIAKLTAILADHPNDALTLAGRAEILMDENKLAEAQADLDLALKIAPKNVNIIFLDGVLLAREGKLEQADAQLDDASFNFNDIPYGYYIQGVVKYQLKQYQQAAASLSKYSARFPDAVAPQRLLARIALNARDFRGAIADLKPVVDANPADTGSAVLLAQAYLATGRREEAMEIYQRAAKSLPNDPKAATNLAVMEMRAGEAQQGLAALDKLADTADGATAAGPPLVFADLQAGRISDAANVAESMVKRNGKDVVAQNLLGTVRMFQGNYSEAAAIFKGIVDKEPNLTGAKHDLAQAYLALGKLDDAKTVLKEVLKDQPNSVDDAIVLARLEARQNDVDGAADLLKNVQRTAVKDPRPGIALLQIYSGAKQWDKALAYRQQLEGEFPANPAVIETVASVMAASGNVKAAMAEYAKIVEVLPDSAVARVRYANYQMAADDKTGARNSLMKAHQLAPHDAPYMENLVAFDMKVNGPDAALATARSFAQDAPQTSPLLVADVLEQSNRADEAVALLTAEQKQNPSSEVVAKLGEVLFAAGKHDEAKQVLQAWIKDHGDDPVPRLALGNLYLAEHDDKDAQTSYEQVHAKLPNDVAAINNLAWLYNKSNDPRAMDYAAQAYRLAPRADTADTLGWVLVKTGKAQQALALLRAASAGLPQDADVQYHLAAALNAAGQKDQARTVLEKLVKSGTGFDNRADAQQLLNTLQHD